MRADRGSRLNLDSENRTGYHSAYHRAPDMLPRLRAHSDQLGWSDTFDYKVLLLVARAVRAEGCKLLPHLTANPTTFDRESYDI